MLGPPCYGVIIPVVLAGPCGTSDAIEALLTVPGTQKTGGRTNIEWKKYMAERHSLLCIFRAWVSGHGDRTTRMRCSSVWGRPVGNTRSDDIDCRVLS